MIPFDPNVLMRLFVEDIPAQAAAREARTTFDTDAGQSQVFTLLPTASPA